MITRKLFALGSILCLDASATPPKHYGVFIHSSSGSGVGVGVGVFGNTMNGVHQIRSIAGYTSTNHRAAAIVDGLNQPFTVGISGLVATLSYRYFPIHWVYLNSGIVHSRQKAEYHFVSNVTQKSKNGNGEATLVSIPVLLGGELGRSTFLSGYFEGGPIFNLLNTKQTGEAEIKGDIGGLKFSRDLIEFKIGFGLSFNWGNR